MSWLQQFQCFLFDFDGTLVNTEEVHFAAYRQMLARYGYTLDWTFPRYCQAAHFSAEGLRDQIYEALPALQAQEPSWEVLYTQKREIYYTLLQEGATTLLPGVTEVLTVLQKAGVTTGVVTHSPAPHIQLIRDQHPLLNTIPHWITRESYTHPKPHPECYQIAIERLAKPNEHVIGFEDTPRGLQSLLGSRAYPVLVNPYDYFDLQAWKDQGVQVVSSFYEILEQL